VYNFLGNVNLFHGRVHEGQTYIQEAETGHLVYVRPHLLDIARLADGGSHFRARIKHINAAGPLVKIEAIAEWGDPVRVELPQERFHSLQLTRGEEVFIIPKDVKVFPGKGMARAK